MNANMKVSEQCRIAASKGKHVLGMIRRSITYKEKSLIVPLYKAIVRPQLEYCIHPYLRKHIDMLDKIQRRATKLIPGLRYITHQISHINKRMAPTAPQSKALVIQPEGRRPRGIGHEIAGKMRYRDGTMRWESR